MKLFNKFNSKTSQDGVSSPSIFAVEDSRMICTVSITDNISDVFIYDEVLMLLENAEEHAILQYEARIKLLNIVVEELIALKAKG